MKILRKKLVLFSMGAFALGIAGWLVFVVWEVHRETTARHHNNLGVALVDPDPANNAEYEEAVRQFQTALRIRPRYHLARVNLGIALFHAGHEDRAMEVLEEAGREDSGDMRVPYTLGLIELRRELFAKAEQRFARVLESDPEDPCALFQLGGCQMGVGADQAAEKTLRTLLSRWPLVWGARYRLGKILWRTGRKQEAGEAFRQLQKDRADPAPFVHLPVGPIGRKPKLIDRYVQVLANSKTDGEQMDRNPEYSDVSRELGIAFQHAGTSSGDQVRKVISGEATAREWFMSAENRQKLISAVGAGCGFADFDNDGHLDFLLVNADGRHALYAQGADGDFRDVTAKVGIGPEPKIGMACVWGDYDNDGWTDLCLVGYGGVRLYRNNRGTFEDVTAKVGIADAIAPDTWCTCGAFADVDHDGDLDLYISSLVDLSTLPEKLSIRFPDDFEGQPDLLFRNNRNGTFTEIAGKWDAKERSGKSRGAWFCDVDGNRVVDLITCDLAGRQKVFLNRLDGTFLPASDFPASSPPAPPVGESRAYGDFDDDGAIDMLVNRNGGVAALLRNRSARLNWLAVRPKRYEDDRGNRRCIGARVEVRSYEGWQTKDLTAGNPSFGCDAAEVRLPLGKLDSLDYVRVTFPSGIQTSIRNVQCNQVLIVEEPDLQRGSCPLVFSWNGERFEFISDVISAGIIGELIAPGRYWMPDPDEWLRIAGESLRAKGTSLDIRFVNALEEVTYLDQVRLIAADHPAALAVYPNEMMVSEPSNRRPAKVYALQRIRPIVRAIDQRGRDVTSILESVDRRYFDGFQMSPFKGFAEDWSLALDLGSGSPAILLLHGWTAWNSPASALAAMQAGKPPFGPILEVQDLQGSWRIGVDDLGVPAGLPRAMPVDLRGVLKEGEHFVRIRSNRTLYLDQALVADVAEEVQPSPDGTAPSIRATEAPLREASLRWLGYPERVLPDGRPPAVFDYQRISSASEWESHEGLYTRYGNVSPLLGSVDDRFAIMAHGDEIALSFDARALPDLPDGWRRTYLFYLNGYEKALDLHGAFPRTVEPLPFRTMPSYPYPEDSYPADPFHLEYNYDWNSRSGAGIR